MMRTDDIRKLLRVDQFVPLRIGLSDGRSVLVRHPDQVFVADRHLLIGLAKLERSRSLATSANGDRIVKDWMIINLVRIAGIEPEERMNGKPKGTRSRKKG
jgi:hypothetical protein